MVDRSDSLILCICKNDSFIQSKSMQKSKVNNKINLQSIAIFEYYLTQLFPSILKGYSQTVKKTQKLRTEYRNVSYQYVCDTIELSKDVSSQNALNVARNIYFKDLAFKIDDYRGLKEKKTALKMIPLEGLILDRIDLFLQQDKKRKSQGLGSSAGLSRQYFKSASDIHIFGQNSANPEVLNQEKSKSTKKDLFKLYVIHHCQQNSESTNLEWLNFIQRFNFIQQKNQMGSMSNFIVYQAVFTSKIDQNILSLDFSDRLLKEYFQNNCRISSKGKVLLLQDMEHEFQCLEANKNKNSEEEIQKLSLDPVHRRSLRLPGQYRPIMDRLKAKASAYYYKINPTRECNSYFLQNLVCRMMENKNYKEEASWTSIENYLNHDKEMRQKYTWDDFLDLREMNFLTYCGKDHLGRPVILLTSRNTCFSKIPDKKKFVLFHNYFFTVYLRDKMDGWVDTFDAIFDTSEQSNDNTDLAVTKELVMQAYKFYLGQSHHVIICKVGVLVKMITKVIFPLIPGSVLQMVEMIGDDDRQILNKLRQYMTLDVIPYTLGGSNRDMYNILGELKLIEKNSMSYRRSFKPIS